MYRRAYLALGSVALASIADSAGIVETTEDDDRDRTVPESIALETIASGLELPLDIAFVPGEDRRYVATQSGTIFVHEPDGLRDEPLLDLTDRVEVAYEMGLLGIELHPNFDENRRLFVRYSSPPRAGTPDDYDHTFVLAEFAVDEDGTRASIDSERTVLEIPQPEDVHNAGDLAFGPDGFLYVPTGDGGSVGDTAYDHPTDWYDENEGGNGQDTSEYLLGGILRIDVDAEPTRSPLAAGDWSGDHDDDEGYAVPADNPLVDEPDHHDEYYAWGFRNPWRLSFDDEWLYVSDVGQTSWESVYRVETGGNYGWNVKEGSHCFDSSDVEHHPEECPDETPEHVRGGEPLRDPIVEYPNRSPTADEIDGVAVIGGYVYRGSTIPGLEGRYVFGDLFPNGRLFVGTPPDDSTGDGRWTVTTVDYAKEFEQLLSLGRDDDGELYVLGDGGVHRIVSADR